MAHSHALLRAQTSNSARPAMQILQAGDHQVLMQYGANEMDIKLNFRAQALQQALSGEPVAGIRETAVGFRSVLITFDPSSISRTSLLDELVEREESVPNLDSLVLQSRTVTMPIAFDDAMTRAAVERYRISVRSDAPNVRDGDNIDYIVHCNGLLSREDFYDTFTEATWWTAFIGYFPGLPFLYSLDPCTQLSAPKYNPARMWTAEGCLALGGPCVAIYPMSVPGSYQLFGRTLGDADVGGVGGDEAGRVGGGVGFAGTRGSGTSGCFGAVTSCAAVAWVAETRSLSELVVRAPMVCSMTLVAPNSLTHIRINMTIACD